MAQRCFGSIKRQDIILPPGQPSGANYLLIYSGEVSVTDLTSANDETVSDQLQILIDTGFTNTDFEKQLIGFPSLAIPLFLPTSWNSSGSNTVVAINNPQLFYDPSGVEVNGPEGLWILGQGSVQQGSLLNAQYQVSVLANLG
jgi:hypothetical protein